MKNLWFVVVVSAMAFISHQVSASAIEFQCDYSRVASQDGLEPAGQFSLRFTLDTVSDDAFMLGNNGLSEVLPIANKYGVTFIEATNSGNVMATTINTLDGESVHSRNSIIGGSLVPSQYYGNCEINE